MHIFDIFSKPFYFNVKKGEEKNKTSLGGIFSLAIVITSLVYFISILITFFQRENPPSITQSRYLNKKPTSPQFILNKQGGQQYYSPVSFRFSLPDGFNDIKRYFKFVGLLINQDKDILEENIQMVQCDSLFPEDSDEWYLYTENDQCLNGKDGQKIVQDIVNEKSIFLYLLVTPCTADQNGIVCAMTDATVLDKAVFYKTLLQNEDFSVMLSFSLLELEEQTGDQYVKQEDYEIFFDPALTQIMQIEYERRKSDIDHGLFASDWVSYTYIHQIQVLSLFLNKDFLKLYYDFNNDLKESYLTIRFQLSRTDLHDKIVFEKFATPLAQFISILNTLMTIGILSVLMSEANIFQQIMLIYLKTYYKQTALDMASHKLFTSNSTQNSTPNQINKVQDKPNFDQMIPQDDKVMKLGIFKSFFLYNTAQSKVEKLKNDQNSNLNGFSEDEQIYIKLFENVQNNQTFQQIYKDILTMKNAIQLLLSPKQYAMLDFVGRNLDKILQENSQNLNHIEQMDKIEKDPKYKQNLCENFILNGQQGNFDSPLDKIIFDCVVQQVKDFEIIESKIVKNENLKSENQELYQEMEQL